MSSRLPVCFRNRCTSGIVLGNLFLWTNDQNQFHQYTINLEQTHLHLSRFSTTHTFCQVEILSKTNRNRSMYHTSIHYSVLSLAPAHSVSACSSACRFSHIKCIYISCTLLQWRTWNVMMDHNRSRTTCPRAWWRFSTNPTRHQKRLNQKTKEFYGEVIYDCSQRTYSTLLGGNLVYP